MTLFKKSVVAFLSVSLVPLMLVAALTLLNAERAITEQVANHLTSVASMQRQRLDAIHAQNLERLALVASRTQLRISLNRYLQQPDNEFKEKITKIISDAKTSIESFNKISITALDGNVIASTDASLVGLMYPNMEIVDMGKKSNSADVFFTDRALGLHLYMSGPLMLNQDILGVIVIESSADNVVSMVRDYSGLGQTGETILAQRTADGDALFITPARFSPFATLDLVVPKTRQDSAFTRAFREQENFLTDAIDYRNEHVLAAVQQIEELNWALVVKIDRNEAYESIRDLRQALMVIMLFMCAVVVAVSFKFARTIANPILNLTNMANRIKDGDLKTRIDARVKGEIGQLAAAFNQMADNLNQSNSELAAKISELNVEIKERKRVEDELRIHHDNLQQLIEEKTKDLIEAKEEAEAANQTKSVFLANMSHEIRTPLNAVLGYAQILLYSTNLSNTQRSALETINRSGNHLLNLINDILDLSKIEAGRMELNKTNFCLYEMLVDISQLFSLRCEQKGLEWVMEHNIPQTELKVKGDQNKLRQVLINLLGNAVKFTNLGRVTLKVHLHNELCEIEVCDTGPGISAQFAEAIFKPFTQDHKGVVKEGTGLGLTIAAKQVAVMGGELQLDTGHKHGARFYFSVPLQADLSVALRTPSGQPSNDPVPVIRQLNPGDNIRALIVDDIEENRGMLQMILSGMGAEVMEADSGVKALELLRNNYRPDIIFMDYRMPGMNGVETSKEIYKMLGDDIKIVMVTASAFYQEQALFNETHFAAIITKPFKLKELYECIESLLWNHYSDADVKQSGK